jgi:hypothetical protein
MSTMTHGALKPGEVRHLASIVNRHCTAHGIRSPEAKESVAASALVHYQLGVTSEDELLEILDREDDPRHPVKKLVNGRSGNSP